MSCTGSSSFGAAAVHLSKANPRRRRSRGGRAKKGKGKKQIYLTVQTNHMCEVYYCFQEWTSIEMFVDGNSLNRYFPGVMVCIKRLEDSRSDLRVFVDITFREVLFPRLELRVSSAIVVALSWKFD